LTVPVIVVGPLAFDDVRTPFDERSGSLGGSGAYASIAAAKLAPTALVSVAGTDLTAAGLAPVTGAGVDITGVEFRGGRTLRWSGTYDATFTTSEVRNTDLGVVVGWRPVVPRPWADTPYVLLANTDPRAQAAALAQLRPAVAVLDTMEEWIVGHRMNLLDVIAGVRVVAANEREAALLGGVEALRRLGPRAVIVKRGAEGASLHLDGLVLHAPAYPAAVVDPTGAGDTLAGAFIARLAALGRADEPALRDALGYGVAAASFAIGSFSVDGLARATRQDLDARARWLAARVVGTGQAARL
jgi:sugar/nucleoside kinase (ribokinase family)